MSFAHKVYMQYSRPYRWIFGDTGSVRQYFFQDGTVSGDWSWEDAKTFGLDAPDGLKKALAFYCPKEAE